MQLDPTDAEFTRQDSSIYLVNLSQRAGVVRGLIRQLVLKELADNALDEMDRVGRPGEVTISQDGEHTYTVTDQGRGFGDSPEELAYRFSIAKPMVAPSNGVSRPAAALAMVYGSLSALLLAAAGASSSKRATNVSRSGRAWTAPQRSKTSDPLTGRPAQPSPSKSILPILQMATRCNGLN